MAVCLYCGTHPAGAGRDAHQLCRGCRENAKARRAFPPKRGGRRPGQNPCPDQPRDRYGRYYFPGETPPRRIDYPGEVN